MNKIWKGVITIKTILIILIMISSAMREKLGSLKQEYFVLEILVAICVAATWAYLIYKIRKTRLAPTACLPPVAVIPLNQEKYKQTKKEMLKQRYKWLFSVPSLILITYIPFVMIPSISRLSLPDNLNDAQHVSIWFLTLTGYICDAGIYCYRTPRIQRRIRNIILRFSM